MDRGKRKKGSSVITITQSSMFTIVPVQEIAIKTAPKRKWKAVERETVARFLHLGAGVQSSTIAEMIVEGDLPRVDAVIFADTGNEPAWVYAQVEYLKTRLASVGIPLIVNLKPNSKGLVEDLKNAASLRFATMPLYSLNPITGKRAILKRQCTNEYKILPNDDFILSWLIERQHAKVNKAGARRVPRNVKTVNIYGISADEKHRQGKQGQAWQEAHYPLIEKNMGRGDCVAYLLRKKLPVPKKSSCIVCPYHDNAYWLDLFENALSEFEQACDFDEWLRTPEAKLYGNFRGIRDELYLHSDCQPLRSIDFKARAIAKKSKQLDMFKMELVDGKSCASDGGFSCFS